MLPKRANLWHQFRKWMESAGLRIIYGMQLSFGYNYLSGNAGYIPKVFVLYRQSTSIKFGLAGR